MFSRKGFDAGYGGMPSPILPDGRLLPLPIPVPGEPFRLGDVAADGLALGPLLRDLSGGRHGLRTRVHLDPDLDRRPALRPPGWRPALGQTGSAQSHLQAQGVAAGDVFVFFGWFRQVERRAGRWRYVPRAPHLHLLFGWLEVGEVLPVAAARSDCLARHPWIASHPHVARPAHYGDRRNTLYIAPRDSALAPGRAGGGTFARFGPALQLTTPGASRSLWTLPEWCHPTRQRAALSFHGDPARWRRTPGGCTLRSVAKGQEFVLDLSRRTAAAGWVAGLVRDHAR